MADPVMAEPLWKLENFIERFDDWAERDSPSVDVRFHVLRWTMSRSEDPYRRAHRQPEFDNYWFAVVPDSQDGKGTVVMCAYWIEESGRTVRCDRYGTLSPPLDI